MKKDNEGVKAESFTSYEMIQIQRQFDARISTLETRLSNLESRVQYGDYKQTTAN